MDDADSILEAARRRRESLAVQKAEQKKWTPITEAYEKIYATTIDTDLTDSKLVGWAARLVAFCDSLKAAGFGRLLSKINVESPDEKLALAALNRAMTLSVDKLALQLVKFDAERPIVKWRAPFNHDGLLQHLYLVREAELLPAIGPCADESMRPVVRPQVQEPTVSNSPVLLSSAVPKTGAANEPEAKPKQYLVGWGEILSVLDKPNTIENQRFVSRLNKSDKHPGPIIVEGRGSKPKVDREKLIEWWNGLEDVWGQSESKSCDKQASVERRHGFGRGGTVAPDIGGSIKRRRGQG